MIKELEKDIYIDYEDPNEKFSFIGTSGPLRFGEENDDYKWKYDYPENWNNFNKGQARQTLIPTSMESRFELYLYLWEKGWTQTRFGCDRPEFLRALGEDFSVKKVEYTVGDLLSMENPWEALCRHKNCNLAVNVSVCRKDLKRFKEDLLRLPGYKFLWAYEDYIDPSKDSLKLIIK